MGHHDRNCMVYDGDGGCSCGLDRETMPRRDAAPVNTETVAGLLAERGDLRVQLAAETERATKAERELVDRAGAMVHMRAIIDGHEVTVANLKEQLRCSDHVARAVVDARDDIVKDRSRICAARDAAIARAEAAEAKLAELQASVTDVRATSAEIQSRLAASEYARTVAEAKLAEALKAEQAWRGMVADRDAKLAAIEQARANAEAGAAAMREVLQSLAGGTMVHGDAQLRGALRIPCADCSRTPHAEHCDLARVLSTDAGTSYVARAELETAIAAGEQADKARKEAESDYAAVAHALGIEYEADGHASEPGPVDALLVHIKELQDRERDASERLARWCKEPLMGCPACGEAQLQERFDGRGGDNVILFCHFCGEQRRLSKSALNVPRETRGDTAKVAGDLVIKCKACRHENEHFVSGRYAMQILFDALDVEKHSTQKVTESYRGVDYVVSIEPKRGA